METSRQGAPRLSVIVPTYGRPAHVTALLDTLARQTLAPSEFEVVVVDDGSPTPLALDPARYPFALVSLRQANAGPGPARNRALQAARAPLVLILNDDARPAANVLEGHVRARAELGDQKLAVLGAFPFSANSLREPFTRVVAESDLVFDFASLVDRKTYGWQYFWTCNISLPRAALLEVGGFDPAFPEAIVEDVELGYRLAQRGWGVQYRADLVCEHEHPMKAEHHMDRAVKLGRNLARMWKKHGDSRVLWEPAGAKIGYEYKLISQLRVESHFGVMQQYREAAKRWEVTHADSMIPLAEKERARLLAQRMAMINFHRGVLEELTGVDPAATLQHGPKHGELVSIVICSYDALDKTRACIDALRRAHDPRHPTEILVVDNGSKDGSAEWLAAQPDITLIENAENLGAPLARNQALAKARGAYVAFLDNDIVVTPGWLERMLYHVQVDALCACVGACADRASHGQQIDYSGPTDPASLAAFADQVAARARRKGQPTVLLASFCLLVRRSALDAIGGFDPAFSPWGFEDDDYTLRAWLAGWHNRIALDVFVRHDTYVGPKAERHNELLQRNWRVFAAKWGLGDVPYGQLKGLEKLREHPWSRAALYVEPSHGAPPAPLPRATELQPSRSVAR